MTDFGRWNEIKRIVQEALDRPEDERERYLHDACGNDLELRHEVEKILAVSETQAQAIDNLQVLPGSLRRVAFEEGQAVGAYRIIHPLSEGGMGAVYLADDTQHHRHVALKTVPRRRGQVLTHEQEILAKLPHPNIAALHTSGTTDDGISYFVMEYVDGVPLTTYCDRQGLTPRQRLELFIIVCTAVSFAHRKGVIHRDIKPNNILVTADGQPKLLDFGIAKFFPSGAVALTLTRPADRFFTVAFASPEQLDGEHTTSATDIYSLGVLLCLLLTGRLPYPVKSYEDLPWAIRNMEPEKPSQLVLRGPTADGDEPASASTRDDLGLRRLSRYLRGDVDAIVLKAVRKEPDRRYETVAEFAADVRRFLADEPVSARKGSTWYSATKFVKKRTGLVLGAGVALLAILGLVIGLAVSLRETAHQRDAANLAASRSQQLSTFLVSIFDLGDPFRDLTTPPTVRQLLSHSVRQLRSGQLAAPGDRVLFLETLGRIYSAQGNYRMALSLYRDALREPRVDPADQARILTELAASHIDLGQFPEARRQLSRARALHNAIHSVPQRDVARRLLITGRERIQSGAFLDASRLFSRALTLVGGIPTERKTTAALHEELGLSLGVLGRFPEALREVNRSIMIQRQLYSTSHPAVASTMMNRAKIFRNTGQYAEATKDLDSAEKVLVSSLGSSHPAVSEVFEERGSLAIEQQDFDLAVTMFNHALAVRTRVLGETHPATLRAYQRLGEAVQGKGDLPQAEAMLRKALADHERFGGDQTSLSLLLNNLGLLLLQRGNVAESRTLLERSLRIREQMHGDRSVWVAVAKANLSNLYLEIGNREAALAETSDAIAILKASFGSQHHYIATGLNNLGFMYADQGQYPAAIQSYREGLKILDTIGLNDDLLATYLLSNLSDALLETGQLDEAHRHIRRAQAILKRKSDPGLPQRDVVNGIEGKYLLLRRAYPEAETKLISSFNGLREKTGVHSQQTKTALRRLVRLYETWGKPVEAAKSRRLLEGTQ